MKRTTLDDFLSSDIGHSVWDSNEVRIILNEEVVFILKMNAYVELDELNLINNDNEFTPEIEKYLMEDYKTIDGVNYIFIKEKTMGFEDIDFDGITIIVLKDNQLQSKKITKDNVEKKAQEPDTRSELAKYLEFKQKQVMRMIEPICHAFQIYNFDYDVTNEIETLILEGQEIACSMNSYEAIIEEVLGYIIVKKYQRHLDDDLKNKLHERIQRSWHKKIKEGE